MNWEVFPLLFSVSVWEVLVLLYPWKYLIEFTRESIWAWFFSLWENFKLLIHFFTCYRSIQIFYFFMSHFWWFVFLGILSGFIYLEIPSFLLHYSWRKVFVKYKILNDKAFFLQHFEYIILLPFGLHSFRWEISC